MEQVNTFLMMGRPGAGKGTQAKLLAQALGGRVYSSGDRLRAIASSGTFFGDKAKEVMARGDLMPEWVSIYLFEDALLSLEPRDVIVFEGSARQELEAREFDAAARWLERPYRAVLIDVSESVLRERLRGRAETERRDDDALRSIDLRFERFREDTERSLAFFRAQGVFRTVNGEQSIEDVHRDILNALGL